MHTDAYTNAHMHTSSAYTQVCADTHEDKPLSFITHHHDYPMITLRAPSSPASASVPGKPSLLHSERQERCELHGGGGGGDDDDHTSYVSFLFFPQTALHKLQAGWLPASLTCNLKQNVEQL